jgi:D-arabinose 1-dehydrogenase-like Zn-dependent alcohol dehydrogenase
MPSASTEVRTWGCTSAKWVARYPCSDLRAVVFDRSISCMDVPEPMLDGGVVLRVKRAGICDTDLSMASGDYRVKTPLVLGHEIFGAVWKAPGERSDLLGRRCVTEINLGCGRCDFCRAGVKSHCVRGEALEIHGNGGFAEYVSTPFENVHPVPD